MSTFDSHQPNPPHRWRFLSAGPIPLLGAANVNVNIGGSALVLISGIIGLIVVGTMYMFREPFTHLLERIRHLKIGDAHLDCSAPPDDPEIRR